MPLLRSEGLRTAPAPPARPRSALDRLRIIPLFAALTDGQLAALSQLLRRQTYEREGIVFRQGDEGESIYIIESGTVRITQLSEDGRELTLIVFGEGEFFGDMSLLDGEPRSATAIAAQESVLLNLYRDDFTTFILRHPPAALEMLRVLSLRLRRTDEVLAEAVFQTATVRLARRLLELVSIYGRPSPEGIMLEIPITQTQLAEMAGATRVTVNKELSHMEGLGVLRRIKRRLLILDKAALKRLALLH